MGFSVKLAPGVRIRASSHGIRAGIGPRVGRVNVGTGRTGSRPVLGWSASTPRSATNIGGMRRQEGP